MPLRFFYLCFFLLGSFMAQAQIKLDLEGGLVFGTNYNKVRIPNTGGSLVNLANALNMNSKVFYRVRAGYTFSERHNVSLLYAPLTIQYHGKLGENVNFNNTLFTQGQPLKVFYKFNSYRLTYRYDFILTGRWRVGAGLTAKIRDADIRFKNEIHDVRYDNLGFVPLVNFYASYKPSYHWAALVEGDALAAKSGRAEDIFAGVAYTINSGLGIKLGYRVLEGGANVDKTYNFNWINYASVGLLISL